MHRRSKQEHRQSRSSIICNMVLDTAFSIPRKWGDRMSEETFNGIFWFGLLALMVYVAKKVHIPDIVYSRERNAIIRMDELPTA